MKPGFGEKLIGIQFGRAVAAILVVFYHGGRMLPQYLGNMRLAKYFNFGNAGVDFFFVLSGFIIYYVHRVDINDPQKLSRYTFRRLTRIYPIYWAVTLLAIAVIVAKRDWADLAPTHLVSSLLLIPQAQEPIVGVAWTLSHEMLFYAVFATLIFSRIVGLLAVAIWTGLVTLGLFSPARYALISFIQNPYHIEFGFGALAAYLSRSHQTRMAPALVGIGIAAFLFVGFNFNQLAIDDQFSGRLMYGLSSALIIYGLAAWEVRGTIKFPGWAAYLGAASYSIYLIHTSLLGWIGKAISKLIAPGTAPSILYLFAVTLSVGGGCLLYQFIEKPLQRLFRRKAPVAVSPGYAQS